MYSGNDEKIHRIVCWQIETRKNKYASHEMQYKSMSNHNKTDFSKMYEKKFQRRKWINFMLFLEPYLENTIICVISSFIGKSSKLFQHLLSTNHTYQQDIYYFFRFGNAFGNHDTSSTAGIY